MTELSAIIKLHEKLIYKIASKFHDIDQEDLFQSGVIKYQSSVFHTPCRLQYSYTATGLSLQVQNTASGLPTVKSFIIISTLLSPDI